MYCGFCDLIITVCTVIIFTDLQRKLATARQEEKKQTKVHATGKEGGFEVLPNRGTIFVVKFLTSQASGLRL